METGNLEFIPALASVLGAVLAAFVFSYREMRRGFHRADEKFEWLRALVTTLQVSVAPIAGYLGVGFPGDGEQRAEDEPPERAA